MKPLRHQCVRPRSWPIVHLAEEPRPAVPKIQSENDKQYQREKAFVDWFMAEEYRHDLEERGIKWSPGTR